MQSIEDFFSFYSSHSDELAVLRFHTVCFPRFVALQAFDSRNNCK